MNRKKTFSLSASLSGVARRYVRAVSRLASLKKGLLSCVLLLAGIHSGCARKVCQVFGFPSAEPGYSLGVSACYAGHIGDWLVMAGGCNFPSQGNKTYYSGIYAARMDATVLSWRLVGVLPEPAAYGVTVESGDSLLFIGGNNKEKGLTGVYSIHLDVTGSRADVRRLADLPYSIDNMAVAKSDSGIYVVGGNRDGSPSSDVLYLGLGEACRKCDDDATCGRQGQAWRVVGSVPGAPRVQPVCAAYNNKVYVWGGFFADGDSSVVHTDGYSLDTTTGRWSRLAAPHSVGGDEMTLSGGIAWSEGGHLYATGGVNKDIFLDAISGRYERVKKDDYLKQPIGWYRFSGNLYEFDTVKGAWAKTVFASESLARAGAVAVPTRLGVYYIGGELKPALRTPQIVLVR